MFFPSEDQAYMREDRKPEPEQDTRTQDEIAQAKSDLMDKLYRPSKNRNHKTLNVPKQRKRNKTARASRKMNRRAQAR